MQFNYSQTSDSSLFTFNDLSAGDLFRSKDYANDTTFFVKTADSNMFFNAVCLEDGELCKIPPDFNVEVYIKDLDIYEDYFKGREEN